MDSPAVLTVKECAALLRCCERTVRRGIQAGRIPHLRVYGRKVVVPAAALTRILSGDLPSNGREDADA